jgi:hypothetical protein
MTFLSLKNDVSEPSKGYNKKIRKKKTILFASSRSLMKRAGGSGSISKCRGSGTLVNIVIICFGNESL